MLGALWEYSYLALCWAFFADIHSIQMLMFTLGLGLEVVRVWAQAQRLNRRLMHKSSPELFSWAWGQAQR